MDGPEDQELPQQIRQDGAVREPVSRSTQRRPDMYHTIASQTAKLRRRRVDNDVQPFQVYGNLLTKVLSRRRRPPLSDRRRNAPCPSPAADIPSVETPDAWHRRRCCSQRPRGHGPSRIGRPKAPGSLDGPNAGVRLLAAEEDLEHIWEFDVGGKATSSVKLSPILIALYPRAHSTRGIGLRHRPGNGENGSAAAEQAEQRSDEQPECERCEHVRWSVRCRRPARRDRRVRLSRTRRRCGRGGGCRRRAGRRRWRRGNPIRSAPTPHRR